MMKLLVTTPLTIAVEAEDVRAVRAEDQSGSFGILPGHADFLTALPVSVLSWRDVTGTEHHVALRGGVLTVRSGQLVAVASREAVCGDDLVQLETEVLTQYQRRQEEEEEAHREAQRLGLAAVKQIVRYLRPDRKTAS